MAPGKLSDEFGRFGYRGYFHPGAEGPVVMTRNEAHSDRTVLREHDQASRVEVVQTWRWVKLCMLALLK